MLSGSLKTGNKVQEITEGRLRGNEITFKAGGVNYTGKLNDKKIDGTYTSGGNTIKWTAIR